MKEVIQVVLTMMMVGLGDTINNTTGTKQVGDGLQSVTGGIEDGANQAGKGAENAGQWKK
jgi:hypothetical protein